MTFWYQLIMVDHFCFWDQLNLLETEEVIIIENCQNIVTTPSNSTIPVKEQITEKVLKRRGRPPTRSATPSNPSENVDSSLQPSFLS